MARLEWKEVEAPDFRNSSAGYLAASKLFGEAIESARGGLEDFQKQQGEAADNQVLNGLLKYQGDPKALEAAMADGSFMAQFDPKIQNRMSAGTRQTLLTRPGALLEQLTKAKEFEFAQAGRDEATNDSAALARNQDFVTQLEVLRRSDPSGAKATALLQDPNNAVILQDLGSRNVDRILKGQLSGEKDQFGHTKDITTFGQGQEDRTVQLGVDAINGLTNGMLPEDRLAYLNNPDNRKALIEQHGLRAYNRALGGEAADGYGAPAGGAGAGGGDGGGFDGIVNSADNISALQETASMLGIDATDLATIMSYETGGTFNPSVRGGKNNKHIGLIQFGEAEQGEFGASEGQSFKEQLPAVAKYLKARGVRPGDDITTLYKIINGGNRNANINASDGNGTIGSHVAKMKAEHGGRAAAFLAGGSSPRNLQTATSVVNDLNNTSPMAQAALTFQELKGDKSSARDQANALIKSTYPGEDVGNLTQEITRISRKHGITPAMAAFVLKDADNGNKSWFKRLANWAPGSDGLSFDVDDDHLDAYVAQLSDPQALADATVAVDEAQQANAGNAKAAALVASIKAQIAAKEANAERTGAPANTGALYKKLAAALEAEGGTAVKGAVIAATGQGNRNGNDGIADAPPSKTKAKAKPVVMASAKPNEKGKPGLLLSQVAAGNQGASWAKLPPKPKSMTPEEFAALMAKQNGKKSQVSR